MRSERMIIGNEKKALIGFLHFQKILYRPEIISEMQSAGGAYAAYCCLHEGKDSIVVIMVIEVIEVTKVIRKAMNYGIMEFTAMTKLIYNFSILNYPITQLSQLPNY